MVYELLNVLQLPKTNSQRPLKWMVGRRSFPSEEAYFQELVSFRECISCWPVSYFVKKSNHGTFGITFRHLCAVVFQQRKLSPKTGNLNEVGGAVNFI